MKLRLAIAAFLLLAAAWGRAETIKEIRVQKQGAAPVDESSVFAYTSIKVGDELSRPALSRDVKTLEKSGRYSYVAVNVERLSDEDVALLYTVQSKPRIRRLTIDGADIVGNKKVREWLALGVGDLVDDAVIGTKAQKVYEEYSKAFFPYTKLTWKIDEDKSNGTADVKVQVDEGRRASVREISFEGNKHLSARALRGAMKQKRWNFFISWITGRGTYKPDDLETDVEAIRRVYMDRGYLDATVGEPVIRPSGKRGLEVQIPVTEGQQYRLGRVEVDGAKLFNAADIARESVTNKPGDVASLATIERTQQAVQDYYGSRGYLGTQAAYSWTPADHEVLNLAYRVKEGELAYIRNISIRGNTRTKDKVIRRELTVYPGDKWNSVLVRNSERRLRNLGYFSYVAAVPEETDNPSQYDLAFEVEEQKTGQFLVGVGYSSVDQMMGFVELSQGNFSLTDWPPTGGGQKLKLRATVGTKRDDVELSFVEPWFLDRKLSLGVDLYQRDSRYFSSEYDQKNLGGRLTLGKPIGNFNRMNAFYGLEQIKISEVSDSASELIKAEAGTQLKSYTGVELIHDTRDSAFIPTRGNRSELSGFVAGGPLGGDIQIYGIEAQSIQYVPVWYDHVLSLKGWASTVEEWGDGERVPIFDRLFLGGARTLRGFKYRKVGPKDANGEPTGGKSAWYATVEYTIPIIEKLRFATFYDVGMAMEDAYDFNFSDFNSDYGIGIRLDFPGFPLRLDYAWPIKADEFNDRKSGRFQFTIGYTF